MNTKLLASAALGAALAASAPAHADGLYIGAFGGVNFAQEADGTGDVGGGAGYTVEVENELGWAAGAAVGYGFDIGLRAEAEVAYRMNELDQANLAIAALDLDGDTTALSIMGNLWFDIPLNGRVRPFVGGGLGMAQVSLNDVEVPAIGPGTFVDDSDWVLAYQLGGGIAFKSPQGSISRPSTDILAPTTRSLISKARRWTASSSMAATACCSGSATASTRAESSS